MSSVENFLLETINLTHIFPDGTAAVRDISFRAGKGEFIIIAGANGSGKTVFIRHLNGLLAPTSGTVLINGKSVGKNLLEARKKIGLIFQDSDSQIVGQTVREDAAFGPENLNLPRAEIDRLVDSALKIVGLSDLSDRNPYTLSGGQKKKLAIAGVLVMNPDIIIFDEPFTGLDYPGVIQILKQLEQLKQSGHTIILVTHELEKVLAHADRLVIFQNGHLVEDGKSEDILSRVEEYGIRMPLKTGGEVSSLTWLK